MGSARWVRAAAALVLLYIAATLPLILARFERGRGAHDQINYHLPAILRFARELPRPDLSNYDSATTPGYHLVLAVFARLVSDDPRALQSASLLFTLALLTLFVHTVARRVRDAQVATPSSPPFNPLLLSLPLACSLYVFSSGAWLLPDNAGWLGVLAVLSLALHRPPTARVLLAAGSVLLLLVLVRQIHLWAAAVIWAAALMPVPDQRPAGTPSGDAVVPVFSRAGLVSAARRLAPAIVVTLPAFAVVAGFVVLWGGLTPPMFQKKLHGGNPAAPAFILALAGGFGVFLLPFLLDPIRSLWRSRPWLMVLAALAGIALAAVPETTYSTAHGRYSGLWNLVRLLDNAGYSMADRTSPLILVLSPVGAILVLSLLMAQSLRDRVIFGVALAGFIAAQTASRDLWQRYSEPFLLMVLPLMAAGLPTPARPGLRRLGVTCVWVLSAALAAVTVFSLASSRRAEVIPPEQDPARTIVPMVR
jgi:hypothetical protein